MEIIPESYFKGNLLMQTPNVTGNKGRLGEELQIVRMVRGRLVCLAEFLIPGQTLLQKTQKNLSVTEQPGRIPRLLERVGI